MHGTKKFNPDVGGTENKMCVCNYIVTVYLIVSRAEWIDYCLVAVTG